MSDEVAALRKIASSPGAFALQVLRAFGSHQGLLLAGAVAYYTLLSIVPLLSLLLVALSHVFDEAELLSMTRWWLELLIAGEAPAVMTQVQVFLEHRAVVGGFGFVVMLFFSTLAFSVLERCMAVIFHHRVRERRHFLVSVAMPYVFIGLLGAGLLVVTVIGTMAQTTGSTTDDVGGILLYLVGVAGLVLMLTAIYLVVPVGKLSFRHALVGGVAAAVLWELARHLMVWYFRTLSMVNLIYGSFATAVLALLSLEVGALILLLGAQVIAEFERLIATIRSARQAPTPTDPA